MFQNLSITDNDGAAELSGGTIVADAKTTLERGPLKIEITGSLISPDGAWIDGSASLSSSGMTAGIGPLYFYALPLNESGVNGKFVLEKPQTGVSGVYEASVEKFSVVYNTDEAALSAS